MNFFFYTLISEVNKRFLSYFIFVFLLIFNKNIAQNSFQKGYYIDENNLKQEGFVYNLDWMYNPSSIAFKNDSLSETREVGIDNIKEFAINGVCKYVKFEGLIDQSSSELANLDVKRNPLWRQSKVLLKVLLESDASLYYYSNNAMQRFFYKVAAKNIPLQQLVFKEYYKNGDRNSPTFNYEFRQQLLTNLMCSDGASLLASKLKYNKKDLVDFFTLYNDCKASKQISYVYSKEKAVKWNFYGLLSASLVNFETKQGENGVGNQWQKNKFNSSIFYRVGAEVELILPINNNKWALFLQPTYQTFSSKNTKKGIYGPLNYSVSYQALQLPLDIRYYLFINSSSKLFANLGIGLNFDLGSDLVVGNDNSFKFWGSVSSFNVGLGYMYNDKLGAELRYTNSTDLVNAMSFQSSVSDIGMVFKYKFN